MGKVQPAAGCLYGVGPLAVLVLLDGVVVTRVYDGFVFDNGVSHFIDKRPANAAAAAGVYEAVLRAGVQRVLAVVKLGVKHHVALLALADKVRQALPVHQVFSARNAACGSCRRKVAGAGIVVALHTEQPVNPAVLVHGQTHVIDICAGVVGVRHCNGTPNETEMVYAVLAFGKREVRLAVHTLHAHHQIILAVEFYSSGVKGSVHPDTFHEEGVCGWIEIIFPDWRHCVGCYNGVFVTGVHTIALRGFVDAGDKSLVTALYFVFALVKRLHFRSVVF